MSLLSPTHPPFICPFTQDFSEKKNYIHQKYTALLSHIKVLNLHLIPEFLHNSSHKIYRCSKKLAPKHNITKYWNETQKRIARKVQVVVRTCICVSQFSIILVCVSDRFCWALATGYWQRWCYISHPVVRNSCKQVCLIVLFWMRSIPASVCPKTEDSCIIAHGHGFSLEFNFSTQIHSPSSPPPRAKERIR